VGSFNDIPWYDAVYTFSYDDVLALEIGEGVYISGPALSARASGITQAPGHELGLITYFYGAGSLFGANVYYSKIVMDGDRLVVDANGARFVDVAALNDMFKERADTATEHTHFLIKHHSASDVGLNALLNTSEDITFILDNYAVTENEFFSMFGREEPLVYFRITDANIQDIILWCGGVVIESGDNFRIIQVSQPSSLSWRHEIFNNSGEIVFGHITSGNAWTGYVSEGILEFWHGAGTFAWWGQFYHIEDDLLSEPFKGYFHPRDSLIGYLEWVDNYSWKVVVRDAFDVDRFYMEFVFNNDEWRPNWSGTAIEYMGENRIMLTNLLSFKGVDI